MSDRRYNLEIEENPTVRNAYSMLSGNIHMESEYKKLKSIVITSSEPKVGKTSVAKNLAVMMADLGKRSILIDADMRSRPDPKVPKWGRGLGLLQFLYGGAEYEEILCYTNVEGLMYIPNGGNAANPIGLLCSTNFTKLMERLKKDFDYIVFDSPALDTVSDASVIASKTDWALLVAKMGKTSQTEIQRSKEKLEKGNARLMGVVLNQVKKRQYKKYFNAYRYFINPKKESNKGMKPEKNVVAC